MSRRTSTSQVLGADQRWAFCPVVGRSLSDCDHRFGTSVVEVVLHFAVLSGRPDSARTTGTTDYEVAREHDTQPRPQSGDCGDCLLYTSDAADDLLCVD